MLVQTTGIGLVMFLAVQGKNEKKKEKKNSRINFKSI